ncbi:transglycosylase domain-containing protein [Uliginosibacterium sp. 31-16]|uniref:transglycosylase domain-containing protein n=1 Tax=Uliginosibacterium sp. 31-16 TaxID=3068315 RepID=UPI00273D7E47|nr:transglycosylase domain-containing protein [Uliginosibacterium sp. 31-16]MDP5238654.1 transglycosylase domain-containing protein [Uliginosibacterium sp. 31-16]
MKLIRASLLVFLLCPLATLAEGFVLPSFEQVRATHFSSDAVLLDRNGQPLADVRLTPDVRRLDWVPLAQLSPAMRDALLRAEDRRFFQHNGVDWLAFAGAAWQNLWGEGKRGASTLTMQLAGLLDPALRMPPKRGERRSYTQKWDQSRAAIELEAHWSKPQILEAYLNLAPFRGDLQGVGAASELLFGLPASQLKPREASLLAALLRGPNARPARVAQRACKLAATLGQTRLCGEITQLANARLDAPRAAPRWTLALQLARARLQQPGQRLQTVLDANLQRRLLEALKLQDDPQAAAVLLDNASGDVLAWVGGVSPQAPDGVSLRRHLPDWHWPALAAQAIESRQFTAASPLPLGWAIFDPRDARAATPAWLSLRPALQGHQIGALLYLQHAGNRDVWLERVRALGFESAGLAGQADIPPDPDLPRLAAAWRAFATGGSYQPARLLMAEPVVAPRRVWRAETAFVMQDLHASQGPGGWAASWTSFAAEDGSAVVVGNSERFTLALVTHALVPQVAWRSALAALAPESKAPLAPEGVLSSLVRFEPPGEAPRREWFLRGTELDLVTVLPEGRRARISFPVRDENYIVAGEPAARDRWSLSAETSVALRWQLDGKPLGEGSRQVWLPQPGRHRLSISDPTDQTLDSVEFDVHAAEAQP